MNRLYLAIVVAVCLTACGADDSQTTLEPVATDATVETNPIDGIDWFDGTIDDAFALAAETGKPIYLYWGAVWCPPCHAISATIFKRPEFVQRSKLFVAVYLDGDTENAQFYGEKFDVRGYPTMIVFDSAGTELTRIPSGIDLQAYANVLDLTLNNSSSVSDLVNLLMTDDVTLAAADCTLLAYYAWNQDAQILEDHDAGVAFQRMFSACPADLRAERSKLYLAWLDEALAAAQAEENPLPLSTEQKLQALQQLHAILADDQLIKANIFSVLFGGADYTNALTEAGGVKRTALTKSFYDALNRTAVDESVYKRERIYTLSGKIYFERMDDEEAEISDGLRREIQEMLKWADETTPSVYERQPIINALGNVLEDARMDDIAKPMLLAELDKSRQPYYFMVSLADIEQRKGNYDVALDWLQKAHAATTGSATRFQWGNYYLSGLLEMAPDDAQHIHDTTVALLDELQNSGGLYNRPKSQLNRLEQDLMEWSEEYGKQSALSGIRESVLQVCASASRQAAARDTCEAFLESV